MRRREFITLVGGAAILWPGAVSGQQSGPPIIAFLEAVGLAKRTVTAFLNGLNEAGYIDGRNVVIQHTRAEGHYARLPALLNDLLQRKPSLIVTDGPGIVAAKAATSTVPIVFFVGSDPIKLGIVPSLHHPGGNLTGVTTLNTAVGPKRLELHELVPTANKIAVLVNPSGPSTDSLLEGLGAASHTLGVELHVLKASSHEETGAVFEELPRAGARALLIGNDALFTSQIERLATLSVQHRIPSIYQYPDFAAAGGLVSYGASLADAYHLLGLYAGRILRGEKPGDLPVQQSTKIELIINLKTAKTLGITVPISLFGRADEVIE
jgi:putative tryptophan/tyrosine transport system substrate-binding protein